MNTNRGFVVRAMNTKPLDKHPKCRGYKDEMNGDYDCGYQTTISCEQCKYGCGRKDPEANCNAINPSVRGVKL